MSAYQYLYRNDGYIQRPPLLSHEVIEDEETRQEPTKKQKHHHRRGKSDHRRHKHHEKDEQHNEKHTTTSKLEKTADIKRDSPEASCPSEPLNERNGRHTSNVAAQNVGKKQASGKALASMKHTEPMNDDSGYADVKADTTRSSMYYTDPSGCLDSKPRARKVPLEEDQNYEADIPTFALLPPNAEKEVLPHLSGSSLPFELTHPGAIAVPGTRCPPVDEELGCVEDNPKVASSGEITARVVEMDEELLEKEGLELRAERDRMHNAPVAQVVPNQTRKKRVFCAAAILMVLILVAVILAVVLTRKSPDTAAILLKCSYESSALFEDNPDLEKAYNASVDAYRDVAEACGDESNCEIDEDAPVQDFLSNQLLW